MMMKRWRERWDLVRDSDIHYYGWLVGCNNQRGIWKVICNINKYEYIWLSDRFAIFYAFAKSEWLWWPSCFSFCWIYNFIAHSSRRSNETLSTLVKHVFSEIINFMPNLSVIYTGTEFRQTKKWKSLRLLISSVICTCIVVLFDSFWRSCLKCRNFNQRSAITEIFRWL